MPLMKPIPVDAAKRIADEFGYDQVVIVARRVGENGGEHCTTYGRDSDNCAVAARIGDFFKFKLMGWAAPAQASKEPERCAKCGAEKEPSCNTLPRDTCDCPPA